MTSRAVVYFYIMKGTERNQQKTYFSKIQLFILENLKDKAA
jgi:hypothetical protein